jgi:hypothetical protein
MEKIENFQPAFLDDEIWDHCLKCGKHWMGIISSCKCGEWSYHVKDLPPAPKKRPMTRLERIKLGREIIASME